MRSRAIVETIWNNKNLIRSISNLRSSEVTFWGDTNRSKMAGLEKVLLGMGTSNSIVPAGWCRND